MSQSRAERSEDSLGRALDRCLADSALKTAGGAAIGIVFSVVLAKRCPLPPLPLD